MEIYSYSAFINIQLNIRQQELKDSLTQRFKITTLMKMTL